MAFDTITGASSSTASTFGGNATNKLSNFLNGSASETANIYDNACNFVDSDATTKKARFDCANITAGQTRKIYPADRDIDLTKAARVVIMVAVSDESTAITAGTAKITFRMPFAMTLTKIKGSLSTASSSGNPAIDVNESSVSVFSTTLTIDANEKTSDTAATPAVISDTSLADDAEITIDIDTAGTSAKGLKVYLIGYET